MSQLLADYFNDIISDPLTQGIGLVAMALLIASFQFSNLKWFFIFQFAGCTLFCVQYVMLGTWGGFFMEALSALRSLILMFGEKTYKKPIFYALMSAFILTAAVTIACDLITANLAGTPADWKTWMTIVVCIAQCSGTVGSWSKDNKKLRLIQLCIVSPCWIVFNIVVMSMGGLFCELYTIISILVYFIRTRHASKKAAPDTPEAVAR